MIWGKQICCCHCIYGGCTITQLHWVFSADAVGWAMQMFQPLTRSMFFFLDWETHVLLPPALIQSLTKCSVCLEHIGETTCCQGRAWNLITWEYWPKVVFIFWVNFMMDPKWPRLSHIWLQTRYKSFIESNYPFIFMANYFKFKFPESGDWKFQKSLLFCIFHFWATFGH
jgi:hypothetical protein